MAKSLAVKLIETLEKLNEEEVVNTNDQNKGTLADTVGIDDLDDEFGKDDQNIKEAGEDDDLNINLDLEDEPPAPKPEEEEGDDLDNLECLDDLEPR